MTRSHPSPQECAEREGPYLKAITGVAFTAKDFRTWAGTVLAFLRKRVARRS